MSTTVGCPENELKQMTRATSQSEPLTGEEIALLETISTGRRGSRSPLPQPAEDTRKPVRVAGLASVARLGRVIAGAPLLIKMVAISLGMSLLVGADLYALVHRAWHQDELQELEDKGRLYARYLALRSAPMVQKGELERLNRFLRQFSRVSQEITSCQVRDVRGNLLAAAGSLKAEARVHEVRIPLADHVPGSISLALNESLVDQEIGWLEHRLINTLALVTSLGILGAAWLARAITRPVCELVQSARAVKAGDYRSRVPERAPDELGELAGAFNAMAAALDQHKTIRQEWLRKILTAAEEERKRVSRDLHDHMGQSLSSLIAGLGALNGAQPTGQVARLLKLAERTLAEAHDLSVALRPQALDELGLVPALETLCRSVSERFEVDVECEAIGFADDARLPNEIEVAFYRICQEAVTNAVRHGKSRRVDVLLQRLPAGLLLVVEDAGCSFDARDWREHCLRGEHLGLLGIEERALLLGGMLRVESEPGAGTRLFVRIPISQERHG